MSTPLRDPVAPHADDAGAVNRRFYDLLWSASHVVTPQRFNTWPMLSALAASARARLEIGPGLRPRLPIAGTYLVDVSRPALAPLQARGGLATLGEITSLPFADASFDLVCAFDIVEHVEDDRQVFRELRRVTRDGATMIFSVPLHPARWSTFDVLVGHVRRYEPDELLAILTEHSFVLERSAVFGMQPRRGWLLDLAVWGLTHRRVQAMRWYNRLFLPLGLLLQRPLAWVPGMTEVANVDEIVLVCRRGDQRGPQRGAEGAAGSARPATSSHISHCAGDVRTRCSRARTVAVNAAAGPCAEVDRLGALRLSPRVDLHAHDLVATQALATPAGRQGEDDTVGVSETLAPGLRHSTM